MEIISHQKGDQKIAEVVADKCIITNLNDALQLLGDLYYSGYHKIVLKQEHLTSDFFDLKTQLAGEILQKFTNFQMQLAIIGDFKNVQNKSLKDFIYESNKGSLIAFHASLEDVLV